MKSANLFGKKKVITKFNSRKNKDSWIDDSIKYLSKL